MGAIGGGIFQAVKGFRNAPSVSSVMLLYTVLCSIASVKCNNNDILIQIILNAL